MEPLPGVATRDAFLQPYLDRFAAFLKARGHSDKAVSITFADRTLAVSPWERRAAHNALCSPTGPGEDWQRLVAEGIAVQLALMRALAGTAVASPHSHAAAELDLAAAMGAGDRISGDLEREVERAVDAGRADDAQRLGALRDTLAQSLAAARQITEGTGGVVAPAPVDAPDPVAEEGEPEGPDPWTAADQSEPERPTPGEDTEPDLGPTLDRASAFLRIRGGEDKPVLIRFGSRTLTLATWERRVVYGQLVEGHPPACEWHRHLAVGTALQLAILPILEELESPGPGPQSSIQAGRRLAPLLGLAASLTEAIRASLHTLVGSGHVDDARRLTAFRNAFAEIVRDARRAAEVATQVDDDQAAGPVDGGPPAEGEQFAMRSAVQGDAGGPSQPTATFEPEIAPYIERATRLLRMQGREHRPLSIPIGKGAWRFTVWERTILWQSLCQDVGPDSVWANQVAKCAALQLALLLAMERLRQSGADSQARRHAREELGSMVDRIGHALDELHATIEGLKEAGQVELAGNLESLHVKIADTRKSARTFGQSH